MGSIVPMMGCCECEEVEAGQCQVKLRVRSCGIETCAGDPPSEIDYEIYDPYTAPTPTRTGTLTYIPPVTPGSSYAFYESPYRWINFFPPFPQGWIRVKILPAAGSGIAPINVVRQFTCTSPSTQTFNLSAETGYECNCTEDPVPALGSTITLTNRYGAVTLTTNTRAGTYPPSASTYNGTQTVSRDQVFTCATGAGPTYSICLGTGGGNVPVYWTASTSDGGCSWIVEWHSPYASVQGGTSGCTHDSAVEALRHACDLACDPGATLPAFGTVGVPGTVTWAQSSSDACYAATIGSSGWNWRYNGQVQCRTLTHECVSRVPLVYEMTKPGCAPCVGGVSPCDLGPFNEVDGDVWTLTA